MRVLIIQENGHHDENRNYRECFCLQRGFKSNGVDSDVWGKGHDNYDTQPDWESYDLIFSVENWDWMPDLSSVKAKKFIWAIDAHCKSPEVYEALADRNNFDMVLHASPNLGVWLPNCYDDTIIKPLSVEKKHEIGFCGNVANRQSKIDIMKANFKDFRFDEFVIGDAMVSAINSYKVHWNANISFDINYRNFETMGCKTALLTSQHSGYEQLGFKDCVNCVIYNNMHEMIEKAKILIKNEDLLKSIANAGYDLASKNHTYKNRAKQILDIMENSK
jgi:glycosyltransferase involved in cell wall biosynthesis